MAPLSRLSGALSALVLFASTCLTEKITLRGGLQEKKLSLARRTTEDQYRFLPPVQSTIVGGPDDELELLDICLVASVDGKFHALNRSSGQMLWSMSSTSNSSPAALGPLVQTQHDREGALDDAEQKELYIIEPQSGDIFILPKPDAPLQRLPYSVPQLVDMSPFSFTFDDDSRVFVGKKETSLLLVELETGRVKGTVSSECPWDAFGETDNEQSSAELDLDELDGTKPPKEKPVSTEVLIGRTDYHVSIHTRSRTPSGPKPPVQDLTFSTYGPNNQDHAIQAAYHRSPDDTYIQSLPNGNIMTFRTAQKTDDSQPETRALWGHAFKAPIVAVFDVLQSPNRQHPLVLLQPKPRLQDFLPHFEFGEESGLPSMNLAATYIGLVGPNGSLFAMSPENFPLVVFDPHDNEYYKAVRRPTIDAPPGVLSDDENDQNPLYDVDAITRARKERERCINVDGVLDRACLLGKRPVEASGPSRLSRLLPDRAAAEAAHRHDHDNDPRVTMRAQSDEGNFSRGVRGGSTVQLVGDQDEAANQIRARPMWTGAAMAFAIFLVGFWYLAKRAKHERQRLRKGVGILGVPLEASINGNVIRPDEELHSRDASGTPQQNGNVVHAVDYTEQPPASHDPVKPPPLPTSVDPVPSTPKTPKTPTVNGSSTGSAHDPASYRAAKDGDNVDEADGEDDSDREGDNIGTPGKKKGTRRRKRGKKNRGGAANASGNSDEPVLDLKNGSEEEKKDDEVVPQTPTPGLVLTPSASSKSTLSAPQLNVSDEVLGYGSHGTVVYRGSLQGRAVAVKRLLQDFVTVAAREVGILQESDDHPNVIRYYYQEAQAGFLYIALELCPASLADVIERPDLHREISNAFDPKRALVQITSGLRHLHALKIIHRDIKPQNILISSAKKGAGSFAGYRMLISDFGLCKKLEVDQTSFLPTAYGAMAAGTVGWRAPEILRGEVKLDESAVDDSTQSSRGSVGTVMSNGIPSARLTRLTKSVDIFALGCLFYYTLTGGGHPYGDRYEREVNILKDAKTLGGLDFLGEEGAEAVDLISQMLHPEAYERPDTSACLIHPFFWTPARRLSFLQDASDRFEIMCRDPREPDLIELEKGAFNVVGSDWRARLDKVFLENIGKFRKYDGKSVQDLMRALRNKKHHYQDLPDNVKRTLGPLPDGFLAYFTKRFPNLFLHVHSVVYRTNLRYESMFKSYFELSD